MIMENALAGKFFKPCFHLNSRKSLVLQKKKGIGSSQKFCYPSKFKIHPLLSHTPCLSNLEKLAMKV
uniref:Uncharacterized protein n=1 Tax=Salix viminalis TaxID=40686 RepID=A0A6N2KLH7_SALVM